MEVQSGDEYSNGNFVVVPVGGESPDLADDFVGFSVTVEAAGDYTILTGVRGPSGSQNSFFASVNGETPYRWNIPNNNVLTDVLVTRGSTNVQTYALDAGVHTFRAYTREAGSQLDFIEFLQL